MSWGTAPTACVRHMEAGRQSNRPSGREQERPTGRQADGKTGGESGRQTDGHRPLYRQTDKETHRPTDRETDGQRDRQRGGQAREHTDREVDSETDRQGTATVRGARCGAVRCDARTFTVKTGKSMDFEGSCMKTLVVSGGRGLSRAGDVPGAGTRWTAANHLRLHVPEDPVGSDGVHLRESDWYGCSLL